MMPFRREQPSLCGIGRKMARNVQRKREGELAFSQADHGCARIPQKELKEVEKKKE